MLPSKYHLNRHQIEQVLKSSSAIHGKMFSCLSQKNDKNHSRFAFVISKKIHKTAPVRNRLKRQLFHLISQNKISLPKDSKDYVLFAKKPILKTELKKIASNLENIIKKNSHEITSHQNH